MCNSFIQEEAERWLVNLVREARLEAKIDSEANHVLVSLHRNRFIKKCHLPVRMVLTGSVTVVATVVAILLADDAAPAGRVSAGHR